MKPDYSFNQRQLMSLCTVLLLAPALRLIPEASMRLAGRAAWLSVPMSLPVILPYVWFLYAFSSRRRDGEGFAELTLRALGGRAGRAALCVFALWFLLYGAFTLRSGADRIITTMYPDGSPAFFIVCMGALCLIAALGSARTLVRAANMFLVTVLAVLLIVLIFALFSIEKENLLPVTADDLGGAALGAAATVDVVLVSAYMAFFLTPLRRQSSGALRQSLLWALGVTLLLFWLMADIVGTFGAELASRLSHPFFALVKNLIFFRSLGRMEALVVSLWVFSDFTVISASLLSAQRCLRLAAGKIASYAGESALDLRAGRWVIWLCAAGCTVCALLIAPDPLSLAMWSQRMIPAANLAVALILLPAVYAAGRIRKNL